jgi:UBX domain
MNEQQQLNDQMVRLMSLMMSGSASDPLLLSPLAMSGFSVPELQHQHLVPDENEQMQKVLAESLEDERKRKSAFEQNVAVVGEDDHEFQQALAASLTDGESSLQNENENEKDDDMDVDVDDESDEDKVLQSIVAKSIEEQSKMEPIVIDDDVAATDAALLKRILAESHVEHRQKEQQASSSSLNVDDLSDVEAELLNKVMAESCQASSSSSLPSPVLSVRESQDRQLQEAMEEDRAKLAKVDEQESRQYRLSELQARGGELGDEPESGDSSVVTIAFRMPDGSRRSRRWLADASLSLVKLWVAIELDTLLDDFDVASGFPQRIIDCSDASVTLEQVNITSRHMISVKRR